MTNYQSFSSDELYRLNNDFHLSVPVAFCEQLAKSTSLNQVLDALANWLHVVFKAERASITLKDSDEYLAIYSIAGNRAIPMDYDIPVDDTMVGKAFSSGQLLICNDLTQSSDLDCVMLAEKGINSCMDAPMMAYGTSQAVGTLNVGQSEKDFFEPHHALKLQCIANWMALHIRLFQEVGEMQVLASTDDLTGTHNRRSFITQGRYHLQSFHHSGKAFVMAMLDIDFFKQLNDKHGHDKGDDALCMVTQCIRQHIRESDLFARFGGEEFVVIMPFETRQAALDRFELIRATIESLELDYDDEKASLTVSIGMTHVNEADETLEHILKRTDIALYKAKAAGRNTIVYE